MSSRLPVHTKDRARSQLKSWLPFHEHKKIYQNLFFSFHITDTNSDYVGNCHLSCSCYFDNSDTLRFLLHQTQKHSNTHIKVHILIILQFPIINTASYRNIFQTIHEKTSDLNSSPIVYQLLNSLYINSENYTPGTSILSGSSSSSKSLPDSGKLSSLSLTSV